MVNLVTGATVGLLVVFVILLYQDRPSKRHFGFSILRPHTLQASYRYSTSPTDKTLFSFNEKVTVAYNLDDPLFYHFNFGKRHGFSIGRVEMLTIANTMRKMRNVTKDDTYFQSCQGRVKMSYAGGQGFSVSGLTESGGIYGVGNVDLAKFLRWFDDTFIVVSDEKEEESLIMENIEREWKELNDSLIK